jgi:glyoxylate carboligase
MESIAIEAAFNPELPQSDGLFAENGLSAISAFKAATGVEFINFSSLVNIFPNPSHGMVNITGLQSGAKIAVTDVQGQIVMVVENSIASQTSIDLSDYNAGVYFIKIDIDGQNIFRKIVLR